MLKALHRGRLASFIFMTSSTRLVTVRFGHINKQRQSWFYLSGNIVLMNMHESSHGMLRFEIVELTPKFTYVDGRPRAIGWCVPIASNSAAYNPLKCA